VETAQQMYDAVNRELDDCDIFISCAAVADFTPKHTEASKIKKTKTDGLKLELVPTIDIVASVASKLNKPFVVGFAAETDDVSVYAKDKLVRKKLDMIAANHVGEGAGFAVDDNALEVFWNSGSQRLPLASKTQLARDLMTVIIEQYNAKDSTENS